MRKLADEAMTEALRDSYLRLAAGWEELADKAVADPHPEDTDEE
jgi:hypothetical protein